MLINTLVQKCIKDRRMTVKTDKFSRELTLSSPKGRGSVTLFPLFPGVTLAYISANTSAWPIPDFTQEEKNTLLIRYNVSGSCKIQFPDGKSLYSQENDLVFLRNFSKQQYIYPTKMFEGVELVVDIQEAQKENSYLQKDFLVDFWNLANRLCPEGKALTIPAHEETRGLLYRLWTIYDVDQPHVLAQMKAYILFLLSCVSNVMNEETLEKLLIQKPETFLTETQVEIAKNTEKALKSDLSARITAKELAEQFGISESSLKNYFKGFYGQNLSSFQRDLRMNRGAELLVDTQLSVLEVANQVGYVNQSKFANTFKKQFGMTPLEYRRKKIMESFDLDPNE